MRVLRSRTHVELKKSWLAIRARARSADSAKQNARRAKESRMVIRAGARSAGSAKQNARRAKEKLVGEIFWEQNEILRLPKRREAEKIEPKSLKKGARSAGSAKQNARRAKEKPDGGACGSRTQK